MSEVSLSTKIAELEAQAGKGDLAAKECLAKVAAIFSPKAKKRGRPLGALTSETIEGASLAENASRARYGKGSRFVAEENAAGGFVDQIYNSMNQRRFTILSDDEPLTPEKWELLPLAPLANRQNWALDFIKGTLAPKILNRIEAGAVEFFDNLAAEVRRRCDAGNNYAAHSPHETALLAYARRIQENNPTHAFPVAELRDCVSWPRQALGMVGAPDEKTIKRYARKLGLLLKSEPRGRPPQKGDI